MPLVNPWRIGQRVRVSLPNGTSEVGRVNRYRMYHYSEKRFGVKTGSFEPMVVVRFKYPGISFARMYRLPEVEDAT